MVQFQAADGTSVQYGYDARLAIFSVKVFYAYDGRNNLTEVNFGGTITMMKHGLKSRKSTKHTSDANVTPSNIQWNLESLEGYYDSEIIYLAITN